jgi:copper(I)-binding protein
MNTGNCWQRCRAERVRLMEIAQEQIVMKMKKVQMITNWRRSSMQSRT